MITFTHAPKGGLGNRLFQLNFIGQLAALLQTDFCFYSPKDASYFYDISSSRLTRFRSHLVKRTRLSEVTPLDNLSLNAYFQQNPALRNFSISGNYLGETFFKCSTVNPRQIVRHKFGNIPHQEKIACHFRGRDFRSWNPKSILTADYYLQAIEYIDSKNGYSVPIQLVTDDISLESIQEVIKCHRHRVQLISNKDAIQDLKILMASRYLVSSPSTFAIWAGVLSDKKEIIHSAKWINERASLNDQFWVDLKFGGNEFYKATQLI